MIPTELKRGCAMPLPTVSGRGFLISDGVTVAFSQAGNAWARLPLVFKNNKRNEDGNWTHDKEILIEGVVFGSLAEYLADNVDSHQELEVTGQLYTEDYEGKTKVKMMVTAAAPAGKPREKAFSTNAAPARDDGIPF